jgi:hypothetical protein
MMLDARRESDLSRWQEATAVKAICRSGFSRDAFAFCETSAKHRG